MCCQPDDCRWSLSSAGIYESRKLPAEAYLDVKVRNLRLNDPTYMEYTILSKNFSIFLYDEDKGVSFT